MAKRAPDRFHVGQKCWLVLKDDPAFRLYDGLGCTVVEARRYGRWSCTDPSTGSDLRQPGLRYSIRVHLRTFYVEQHMLRPVDSYADEEQMPRVKCVRRSTWTKFVDATGVDPRAKPAERQRKGRTNA